MDLWLWPFIEAFYTEVNKIGRKFFFAYKDLIEFMSWFLVFFFSLFGVLNKI